MRGPVDGYGAASTLMRPEMGEVREGMRPEMGELRRRVTSEISMRPEMGELRKRVN
jgi:hypothetical protein